MNAKEALQEIKNLLFTDNNKEVFGMTEGKLEDGTIVKYNLETSEIFVVGQDGADIPAPVGKHKLETGEVVIVVEEGKIAEIKKAEEEDKIEVEIEAASEEDKKEDKPNLEEEMSSMKSKYEDLEKKVEEMAKKMEEMGKANEKMSQAIGLSAQVLETLAKEPSAEPIQKPNNFHSQLKNKKQDNYNKLQQVFQNLKSK
jgi:hypothetical protein